MCVGTVNPAFSIRCAVSSGLTVSAFSLDWLAAYGYDEVARQSYYRLRAHVRICWLGAIVATTLAPANVHDTKAAEELLQGVQGLA